MSAKTAVQCVAFTLMWCRCRSYELLQSGGVCDALALAFDAALSLCALVEQRTHDAEATACRRHLNQILAVVEGC